MTICDWIDEKGGPTNLDTTEVFEIVDSFVFQIPPTGYNFIPTLNHVFGTIDYYLGFDGSALTGCSFLSTFGRTDTSYGVDGQLEDRIRGGIFLCPESGMVQSITALISSVNANPHNWKAAVYDAENFPNAPLVLIGESDEILWGGYHEQHVTLPCSIPIPVENRLYFVCIFSDARAGGDTDGCWTSYGTVPGATYLRAVASPYTSGFPAETSSFSINEDTEYCIYCSYIPS